MCACYGYAGVVAYPKIWGEVILGPGAPGSALGSGFDRTSPKERNHVTRVCRQCPNNGTYWMPVIAGEPYYFIVRYYGPDLDALPPGPCDRK